MTFSFNGRTTTTTTAANVLPNSIIIILLSVIRNTTCAFFVLSTRLSLFVFELQAKHERLRSLLLCQFHGKLEKRRRACISARQETFQLRDDHTKDIEEEHRSRTPPPPRQTLCTSNDQRVNRTHSSQYRCAGSVQKPKSSDRVACTKGPRVAAGPGQSD